MVLESKLMLTWYAATMLALEAGNVIGMRLSRVAWGGSAALWECHLMMTEKVEAAFEASAILAGGGSSSQIIDNYRKHVAANALRLR
jgi:hypothetical protein